MATRQSVNDPLERARKAADRRAWRWPAPGEIIASLAAVEMASADVSESRRVELKGIAEHVEAVAVAWR